MAARFPSPIATFSKAVHFDVRPQGDYSYVSYYHGSPLKFIYSCCTCPIHRRDLSSGPGELSWNLPVRRPHPQLRRPHRDIWQLCVHTSMVKSPSKAVSRRGCSKHSAQSRDIHVSSELQADLLLDQLGSHHRGQSPRHP